MAEKKCSKNTLLLAVSCLAVFGACFGACSLDFPRSMIPESDADVDAAIVDGAIVDAAVVDAAVVDAGDVDASETDAEPIDAEVADAEVDAAEPGCGDGILEEGEECDDDNVEAGDGCDGECRVEEGWYCSGEPSVCETQCGDGIRAGDEACDDANQVAGDGCNSNCEVDCSNESTTDCNLAGETLNTTGAFVDQNPPDGFVQCAGFRNTNQNDVAAGWEANCLGEVRTLRIRYWSTDSDPWELLGDAVLDPESLADYETQVFDTVNSTGTMGFLAADGVTLLKDDPASPTISSHVCNPGHPTKEYAATDLYFGDENDTHTLLVCGYSDGDGVDAQCGDNREIYLVPTDYSLNEGCGNDNGVSQLAVAIYYEL